MVKMWLKVLGPILFLSKSIVLGENIPATVAFNSETYTATVPSGKGSYWSLKDDGGVYKGSTNTPNGVKFDASKTVYSRAGLEAHPWTEQGKDTTDTTVRFLGEESACLKFAGFSQERDKCLKNPALCDLIDTANNQAVGISLSIWMNLPQDFTTEPRYILDTGADEYGKPGIAIYFTGSTDGRQFTHQITVLVSTGPKFWKVTLNGMTQPYAWNNLGIRWSQSALADTMLGLQVFVNKTSVAWKRYQTANTNVASETAATASDVMMTLGCKNDGTHALIGSLDNLAVWYWRLPNNGASQKPAAAHYGQLEYFDGHLTFNEPTPDVPSVEAKLTDPTVHGSKRIYIDGDDKEIIPWMYQAEVNRLRGLSADHEAYLDDTMPAKEGDCQAGNANTWGDGGDDRSPHPVDCADTRAELQAGLEKDKLYSGYELSKAIIRVVNKAGPSGLSDSDFDFVVKYAIPAALVKIQDSSKGSIDETSTGKTYANLIFATSRLQEISLYQSTWKKRMATDKEAGLSYLMQLLDNYLLQLASKYGLNPLKTQPAITSTSANNTAAVVIKTRVQDVKNDVIFPDYGLAYTDREGKQKVFYDFPEKRKESWQRVTDYFVFPQVAVTKGYTGSTAKEIVMVGKIYNKLQEHLPAVIDNRVTGINGLKFFVNSRVLSYSATPLDNWAIMRTYPLHFYVEHTKPQPDAPYRKGAILCVAWGFNELDGTKLGAWDVAGCSLLETNDTHSKCQCDHFTDYAILMEDHEPVGRVSDTGYYVCYGLYGVSLICLIIFMCIVIMSERLHYEVHIVHFNMAAAMFFALCLYLMHLLANDSRIPCIMVSFFMHYSYQAAYMWCAICSHYVFRSVTTGKLGGKILGYYSYIGWGFPALIVIILAAIDVSRYGIGDRCLGAHNGYFLWIYIGIFLFLCFVVMPLFVISLINVNKLMITDPTDRSDVTWSLIGTAIYWPLVMIVWLMAMFVYLVPQENQIFDFLFEIFNALQGIFIFILLGILVPSFRKALFSCGNRSDDTRRPSPKEHEIYDKESTALSILDIPAPISTAPSSDTAAEPILKGEKKKKKKKKKDKVAPSQEDLDKLMIEIKKAQKRAAKTP